MRPLAIATVCFPALGGSGVIAAELAAGLADRGHRVHVLATGFPDRARATAAAHPQLALEPIDVPASPALEHDPYCLAVANKLVELVRRAPIDVVHLHYAVPHAASALLAAQVLGDAAPPMVLTLHGTDATRLAAHTGVQAVTAFAVAACDAITVPSLYLRGEVATAYGVPADRIQVIPNFVDLERFAPPAVRDTRELAALFAGGGDPPAPGDPILFHVSNLRPIKRPGDLVEVLARVRRELPARMIVVGDGPERAAVEARASALGLDGAVRFLGRRGDFAGLLGHADAFVLTSESESFGLAALEALACGVPVFGYRVGGVPEVVAGGAGTLVAPGDLDALAAAVVDGVRPPSRRDDFGRAARARAEAHFAGARAVAAYEACYRHAVAGRTRKRGAVR